MYKQENPHKLIRHQNNSSNAHLFGNRIIPKFIFPKIYQANGDKTAVSSLSRLPLRSRSVNNRGYNTKKDPPHPKAKLGSLSTWSDLSLESGRIRSSSISLSRLKSASIKAEVLSRDPWNRSKHLPNNVQNCSNKFPKHRNNSSCNATVKVANGLKNNPKVKIVVSPPKEPEIVSKPTEQKVRLVKDNQSIFKFFKMKVNSYRDKIVEEKIIKPVINNEPKSVEVQVPKSTSRNILESPKTKDFLLKLYNECKKLNGNITKLYSDTNPRHGRLKNMIDKSRNLASKKCDSSRRSRSSININVQTSSKDVRDSTIDPKRSDSDLTSKKAPEGHYYHLACVISPDIGSTNYTRKALELLPAKCREKGKILSEEMTNISSVKTNLCGSSSTSSIVNQGVNNITRNNNKADNKYTIIHELDDTLCDLDEEMQTDSSGISNVEPNEIKSPVSQSNYVTANDQNGLKKSEDHNKDSVKISSSLELPPIPSMKDVDFSEFTQKVDPPGGLIDLMKNNDNEAVFIENQATINKFITVFEKQFPHRFVLRQYSKNNGNVTDDLMDSFSNFTSTLTVNCSKSLNKPLRSSKNFKFFNPFKPPKCQVLKPNVSYNFNNNNSVDDDENMTSSVKTNEFSNQSDINADNQEPLKRVAPLSQLLQHSRTSEQMNEVITNQRLERQTSPTSNSCIEKQRQKKIARQQEQHQKAKDMAVEAARLRKERQSEMKTFDSFDSSRIVEKLFTNQTDDNYPEFSLFDAAHYNFHNKKPRKPRPLAQSTITGILPEGPLEEPEPPKSPITTEKFRSQPFKVEKKVKVKKEIDKEVLAKYEPPNTVVTHKPIIQKSQSPPTLPILPSSTELVDAHSVKKKRDKTQLTSSSSSSSESSTQSISILSKSSKTSSTTISTSSSSSSIASLPIKTKKKRKTKPKKVKEIKSSKSQVIVKNEVINEDIIKPIAIDSTPSKITVETVCEENKSIIECKSPVKERSDMNVGTEDNDINSRFEEIMATNKYRFMNTNVSSQVDCHLNYQNKYTDNVLDRTLPLNLIIPTPNTSLTSFAHELNTQLHSLADTVDILLNRMDVLEVNILDCSKYFVHR